MMNNSSWWSLAAKLTTYPCPHCRKRRPDLEAICSIDRPGFLALSLLSTVISHSQVELRLF